MATSNFVLDLSDIVEEAFERATGGQRTLQTGYDYRTARRSLNLLTMEWSNRGVNLWTLEQGTIPLSKGVAGYQLPADTIDLVEYSVRQNTGSSQFDQPMQRISISSYAAIPNKNIEGRPQQIYLQRLQPYPVLTVWPVPASDEYTLVGWRLKRVQDTITPADSLEIPFRFMPALIAGMAFYMAQKLPEGADRAVLLKQEYESAFDLASLEDRDKADARFVPRIARI